MELWIAVMIVVVSVAVVVAILMMLSRIETATKRSADLLQSMLFEVSALNQKALEARRDGIKIDSGGQ